MAKKKLGRSPTAYARRGPVREPYDYVLIVCEGTKTEPNYLQGVKAAYRLSNANIRIMHAGATDPLNIVLFAETELERGEYDCAYCVFDRDGHQTYQAALQRISNSQAAKDDRLRTCISIPCFEVWPLLHFCFSSRPFTAIGSRSAGERVVHELQKNLPNYTKGQANIFAVLSDHLETAMKNAKKLEAENKKSGSNNPATDMHKLVEYLRKLKKP